MLRAALVLIAALGEAAGAGEILLAPVTVAEEKALFGRVESRFVVPARARIGGTLTALDVSEGSAVEAGAVIARITDPKLESGLAAAEARIGAATSQRENAQSELDRVEELLRRGATTAQRVDQARTTLSVAENAVAEAEAARAVTFQQIAEGAVLAPAAGRVLSVPLRLGEVVMPGEPVATIAGGGVFLRLAIPERHAGGLDVGATVATDGGTGTVEKLYPLIEQGRVTADVAVAGLSDTFIGQRVLVRVPVAKRAVLAVPPDAVTSRSGLDFVRVRTAHGAAEVTVIPGALVETADGPRREILTGLRAGDTILVP